jgi:hypothetical protein
LASLYLAVALLAMLFGIYAAVFSSVPIQPPRAPLVIVAKQSYCRELCSRKVFRRRPA